jgi:hypothetical protein
MEAHSGSVKGKVEGDVMSGRGRNVWKEMLV